MAAKGPGNVTLIDDSHNTDWARVAGKPAQLVTTVAFGTPTAAYYTYTFNSGTLTFTKNVNS